MLEKPFKTIVVGVDFSPYSKLVVKQADLLCHLWDSNLVLVHAIHDPVDYAASAPYFIIPNIISSDEYVTRIKDFYKVKNVTTRIYADRGTPSSLIQQTAKRFHRPLIMVGYKGHNPIAEFFFGSTAQTLALKSRIPVWIHRGNKAIKPDKVLIPHDLSRESSRSIDVVRKLSLANPTSYEVFYVNQKPFPVLDYSTYKKMTRRHMEKAQRGLNKLLKDYPKIPFVYENGEIGQKIAKQSKKFDLLVMSHHNPTSFLSRSETANVMKKINVPIIVTH